MRKNQIIASIILITIILFGFIWWYKSALPSEEEITAGASQVIAVNSNLLTQPTILSVLNRDLNGNVPVIVVPAMLGRDNPFAKY